MRKIRQKLMKNESNPKIWKWLLIVGMLIVVLIGVAFSLNLFSSSQSVSFQKLNKKEIPKRITSDIIPQYRGIERALACKENGKVYVMVMRGEKPTSGYSVSIQKINLEPKNGKTHMVVYASFKDPKSSDKLSQLITYPMQVVCTDLKGLPNDVELRIEFSK